MTNGIDNTRCTERHWCDIADQAEHDHLHLSTSIDLVEPDAPTNRWRCWLFESRRVPGPQLGLEGHIQSPGAREIRCAHLAVDSALALLQAATDSPQARIALEFMLKLATPAAAVSPTVANTTLRLVHSVRTSRP